MSSRNVIRLLALLSGPLLVSQGCSLDGDLAALAGSVGGTGTMTGSGGAGLAGTGSVTGSGGAGLAGTGSVTGSGGAGPAGTGGMTGSGGVGLAGSGGMTNSSGGSTAAGCMPGASSASTGAGGMTSCVTCADCAVGDCVANMCVPSGLSFCGPLISTGIGWPRRVELADMNGDGKLDLVTAHGMALVATIQLGNGDGTFQQPIITDVGYLVGLAIGDLNGDLKPDVVVTNSGPDELIVLLGNGDGTLQPQNTYAVAPTSVTLGDFNGDGKTDIVGGIHVLLGNGDGSFQTKTILPQITNAVAVADFNGDGKVDIADFHSSDTFPYEGYVDVLLGNGDGTFQPPIIGDASGDPTSAQAGDFNCDGIPDIATTNGKAQTNPVPNVTVLLGKGDGTFLPPIKYPAGGGTFIFDARVSDINGDGRPDIVCINSTDEAIHVLLGNGDGTFQPSKSFSPIPGFTISVGDLNGDGKPDTVARPPVADTFSALINKSY